MVEIGQGRELEAPVFVHATAQPGLTYGHLVIDAGRSRTRDRGRRLLGLHNPVRERRDHRRGRHGHSRSSACRDWDCDAVHLTAHSAQPGSRCLLKHVAVNLGGALVRLAPTVNFTGPGLRRTCSGSASPVPVSISSPPLPGPLGARVHAPTFSTRTRCSARPPHGLDRRRADPPAATGTPPTR